MNKPTAAISADGLYRYSLSRTWSDAPTVGWLMINPSTADAKIDDPTIRKCIGFAKRWGAGGIEVVNLFAYRSSDPKALVTVADPVGPEFHTYFDPVLHRIEYLVAAWGCDGAMTEKNGLLKRRDIVLSNIRANHPTLPIRCLGRTKKLNPKHPLMLAYDTPLKNFFI